MDFLRNIRKKFIAITLRELSPLPVDNSVSSLLKKAQNPIAIRF